MIFVFSSAQGQEKTAINVEVGLPFFTKNKFESHYKHIIIGIPRVSIDRPFFIKIKEKEKISINPGLGYFGFKEKKESGGLGGLGGQSSGLLNHTSFNVFTKASLQNNFSKNNIYFGALVGLHFYTKTQGTLTHQASYQNPPINTKYKINESGKDFFNSIYYGFFTGLKTKSSSKVFIHSFEFSYFPNFIKYGKKGENHTVFGII